MGPGATRNTASAAVEAVLSSILATAQESPKVHVPHLGTFEYPPPSEHKPDKQPKLKFRPAKDFLPPHTD